MSTEQNGGIKKDRISTMTPERRRRINRLKKMIKYTVLFMILVPMALCVFFWFRLYRANRSIEALGEQIRYLERALQYSQDAEDRAQALLTINGEIYSASDRGQEPKQNAPWEVGEVSGNDIVAKEGGRKVYLTFDDGPSIYTGELLDILAEYDVKATFFVTGKGKEQYGDTYRRIVEEGHTLGMHTYSHEYGNIYASLESFRNDLTKLQNFLYDETGVVSRFYRFPGGSSNKVSRTDIHELIDYLNAMDITYFDWNISAGDATSAAVSSDQIVERVMSQLPAHQAAVVLMHDAADKRSTVDALPKLISRIQAMDDDTEILPITDETMLIQHTVSR